MTYVRMFREDFIQEILAQDEASRRAELEQKQKPLIGAHKRMEELDTIIQHIYEDNALGLKISITINYKIGRLEFEEDQ